ncbi:MAG: DUF4349 domain-containing protein [Candidatus Limnocylindrales bacterium]
MTRSHTRPARRPLFILFSISAALMVVAACASSTGALPDAGANGGPVSAPAVLGAGDGSGSTAGGTGNQAVPEATSAPAQRQDAIGADSALIVRTGSLDLEVKDFDASLAKARTAIVGLGGYVSASQLALDGDRPYGSITYRVPSARWDDAVTALKGLSSKVVKEQTQAVEVTKSVVDLEAHIANRRATEQQLMTIMTKAVKIADILEVQAQLDTVRGDIEQLVAERDGLKDQASYGTLTVGWSVPVVAAVTVVQQGFDASKIVDTAVAQLVQWGQGLLTIGIWLAIIGLPLLIGGLLVFGIVWFIFRRLVGRSAAAATGTEETPA